jgi:hypothetical protein
MVASGRGQHGCLTLSRSLHMCLWSGRRVLHARKTTLGPAFRFFSLLDLSRQAHWRNREIQQANVGGRLLMPTGAWSEGWVVQQGDEEGPDGASRVIPTRNDVQNRGQRGIPVIPTTPSDSRSSMPERPFERSQENATSKSKGTNGGKEEIEEIRA